MDAVLSYENSVAQGMSKIQEGSSLIEAANKKALANTMSADEACKYYGITMKTLIKRGKANLIGRVTIAGRVRYFKTETIGGPSNE